MLMRVATGVIAVVLAWLAVRMIKAGAREWRGTGDVPLSHRMRFMPMDDEALAGRDRGAAVMGLCFAFWVAPFAVVTLAGNDLGQDTSLKVMWAFIAVLGFAGFLICAVIYELILNFNRPKFLVPPRHRHEPGAIAGRRRRKQEGRPMKSDWRSADQAERVAFEAAAWARPAVIPSGSTLIQVSRRRVDGARGTLRGYAVVVDGRPAGKVTRGRTAELPVLPGRHSARLQAGRWASRAVAFDATAGDVVRLACEPGGPGGEPFHKDEENGRRCISLTRVCGVGESS